MRISDWSSDVCSSDRTIDSYLQFWNSEEDDQRRIGGGLFANDVSYHAIVGVLTGVDALVDFRAQLIENVGEVRFQARQPADQHHDRARLLWEVVREDGSSFAAGTDVIAFAPDGLVRDVSVFLDRAPSGFRSEEHTS